MFAAWGSVPDDGMTFEMDVSGMHIQVLEIKEHRLVKALVCLEQPPVQKESE